MNNKHSILLLFLVIFFYSVQAQNPVVKIWPNLAPGSENLENKEEWTEGKNVSKVYQPDVTVFLPEHQEGPLPAIIVFPGGGYRKLVMEKEGYKVARWFNEHGMTAFVLKYRLNPDEALRDAQRAVSLIREDAEKYGIDANKIGVIGFSAGAHLAGNLAIHYESRESYDAVDAVSSKPDFWVSIYGGYRNPKFDKNTPPAFIVHAGNDSKVPVMSSVELYTDLKKNGVPAELHVYEQGEHGFALQTDRGLAVTSTVNDWSERLLEWLKVRGILLR